MSRQKFVLFPSPCHCGNRKKNRLDGFDYSSPGYYFVTICLEDQIECFGEVKDKVMILNHVGEIVDNFFRQIPAHYRNVVKDQNLPKFVWQRSFYDHIIRNEDSYKKIKFYVQDNPAKWRQDRNNSPNLYM